MRWLSKVCSSSDSLARWVSITFLSTTFALACFPGIPGSKVWSGISSTLHRLQRARGKTRGPRWARKSLSSLHQRRKANSEPLPRLWPWAILPFSVDWILLLLKLFLSFAVLLDCWQLGYIARTAIVGFPARGKGWGWPSTRFGMWYLLERSDSPRWKVP